MRVFAILIALSLFSPNVSFASDGAEYLDFQDNVDGNKTLKDLPPEIFYNIAEYFGIKDIAHMLLVSKNLHEVFIPILFRYLQNNELKLDLSNRADLQLLIYINSISQGRDPYLKIKTAFKKEKEVNDLLHLGKYIVGLYLTEVHKDEFLDKFLARAGILDLRSLDLPNMSRKTSSLVKYAERLINLESLNLSRNRLEDDDVKELALVLPKFTNLKELNLAGNCNITFSAFQNLDPAFAHLPNLESLALPQPGFYFLYNKEIVLSNLIDQLFRLKKLTIDFSILKGLIDISKKEDVVFLNIESLNLLSSVYSNNIIKMLIDISLNLKFPNLKSLNLRDYCFGRVDENSKEALDLKEAYPNVEIRY